MPNALPPQNGDDHTPDQIPDGLSFEDALDRVERIVDRIERGEVGLEDSLTEYEKGVELIRRCRAILQKAEQKVEELTKRVDEE